jgi:hypothetical protein
LDRSVPAPRHQLVNDIAVSGMGSAAFVVTVQAGQGAS